MTNNLNKLKFINPMKKLFLIPLFFLSAFIFAQSEMKEMRIHDLPILEMREGVNIHLISPEPIQFVDLSTERLIGDLPAENIARIKIAKDSLGRNSSFDELGVITVVGQSFMAQYKVNYRYRDGNIQTNIQIQPEDMQPIEFPRMKFSNYELTKLSKEIYQRKTKKPLREVKDMKLKIQLNNVYVMSDYIFLDINFINDSNLSYNVDGIKFTIEDKKIFKATNNQSLDVVPVFKLFGQNSFRKNFHNIYVFKKFTYPNSKVLKIRLVEEQFSGRTVEMDIKYSDILNADTF